MSGTFNFVGMKLEGDPAAPASLKDMLELFELLKPKPSSHPLMRIGENCDGSYLVPEDLDGITACFSPGVNNFKHFEDTLVDTYGIDCHMCDFSSDVQAFRTPLKEGKQTFQKKWLDIKTEGDNISFDDWIGEDAPSGDLLLQMDIEGAEYRNLLSVSEAALARFRSDHSGSSRPRVYEERARSAQRARADVQAIGQSLLDRARASEQLLRRFRDPRHRHSHSERARADIRSKGSRHGPQIRPPAAAPPRRQPKREQQAATLPRRGMARERQAARIQAQDDGGSARCPDCVDGCTAGGRNGRPGRSHAPQPSHLDGEDGGFGCSARGRCG